MSQTNPLSWDAFLQGQQPPEGTPPLLIYEAAVWVDQMLESSGPTAKTIIKEYWDWLIKRRKAVIK